MNHRFWNPGGESGLATIVKRPATMIAALLAVIVVVLSMVASTQSALAEPKSTAPIYFWKGVFDWPPPELKR